ncbi:hypothetical protein DACRYDRAFT_111106 [Dacryopinax primogenitus]|uniref:Protein kinase domain-containing protein n=1 Tax=Dacryopinax primogenitus (strain DJM 731) TaxID=1858805 RepID=M5FP06_DACPD|nr:uncharacterized protein DACRYDRAFT_111106 [Dacryopinax primogenitus]EJT98125.1 hypothetical protein DACRYDRAFT_111106 [Dacryopinax primogenitus]
MSKTQTAIASFSLKPVVTRQYPRVAEMDAAIEAAFRVPKRERMQAERNPLKEGTLLKGTRATRLLDQEVSPVDADAALAVLPYRPPVRPRLPLAGEDESISLTLTRGLQTGKDRWAQVWLASVHIPSTTEQHQVVIKLLQEAFFPYSEDDDDDSLESLYRSLRTSAGISRNEGWAFAQLRPLQGLLLPHSYGFYHFQLPCGQSVIGHAMEYVEGTTLERDYQGMIDGSFYSAERQVGIHASIVQLAFSVYCLHLCGVHHGDMSPQKSAASTWEAALLRVPRLCSGDPDLQHHVWKWGLRGLVGLF